MAEPTPTTAQICYLCSYFQPFHDAAITRSATFEMPNASLHSLFTKYWELFSSKKPKGFGKFYDQDSEPKKADDASKKPDDKDIRPQKEMLEKEFKEFEKKIDRMFFKEKTKSGDGGGGKGRPIGGGEDSGKYYMSGFVAATVITLGIMYYSYYLRTEISWKEFIRFGMFRDS